MPIDRANVGSVARQQSLERTVSQQGTDIKRLLRRIGELVDTHQPPQIPGEDDDNDGAFVWGTTDKAVSRNTTDITVTVTIGGTGTRTAIEGGIMKTGDTLASGALVRIEMLEGVWRIVNADCDEIT